MGRPQAPSVDDDPFSVFQQIRKIVRKRIAVPDKTLADTQIRSNVTLETTSPAIDPLAREAGQYVNRLANGFQLFRFRELPRLFMVIAVARHVMSGCVNRLDAIRVSFRQSAAGNEGRFEVMLFQEA